jgi:hypothetical protein
MQHCIDSGAFQHAAQSAQHVLVVLTCTQHLHKFSQQHYNFTHMCLDV